MSIAVRMSQAGYCPRLLSAMLLGREMYTPTWLQTAAEEGNWHEDRLKSELRRLGCDVLDEQREVVLDFGSYRLVGHIDGLVQLSSGLWDSPFTIHYLDCSPESVKSCAAPILLEVKSFGFLEYQRWVSDLFEGFFSYAVQHTLYRRALGMDLSVLAAKDRSGGRRELYFIGKDPADLDSVRSRVDKVVEAVTLGDLAEATYDPDSLECRRCAVRDSLCAKTPVVGDSEVVILAQAYVKYTEQLTELENELEQVKDRLRQYAEAHSLDRFDAGEYTVTYSKYTRETVSLRALLSLVPREVVAPAISTSEVRRLQVRPKSLL
ncbi:MAG: hypothetical protein QW212_00670 [Nitrososphaerales archaeon]